jgi:hypothetical protein
MRITTSKTPPASERDQARFRVLIEPPTRTKSFEHGPIRTLGDLLERAPIDCGIRRRWYSPTTGHGGIREVEPCGLRTCPTCVVTWLIERVAPAWAYWNGKADVLEFPRQSRNRRSIRMRGDEAEPGVLSLADGTGTTIIKPGTMLRGTDLDNELVARLRALPLEVEDRSARGPNDNWGKIRRHLTADDVRAAAKVAGIEVWTTPNGRWHYDAEPEQNAVFVRELWSPSTYIQSTGGSPTVYIQTTGGADTTSSTRTLNGQSHNAVTREGVHPVPVVEVDVQNEDVHDGARCRMCDATDAYRRGEITSLPADWMAWHDREWYLKGNPERRAWIERMHYPYTCGVGGDLVEEGGYLYPRSYIENGYVPEEVGAA